MDEREMMDDVQDIPLEKINPPWWNPNKRKVEEYFNLLKQGSEAPPILVFYSAANHVYVLHDGRTRYRAAVQAGRTTIQATILGEWYGWTSKKNDYYVAINDIK